MSSSQVAGQFAQGITANEQSTKNQIVQGNMTTETEHQGNFENSPSTGIDSTVFKDSGYFEGSNTNSPTREYKDWILYDDEADLPSHGANEFFANLDASTKANHGSIYDGTNNESNSYIERGTVHDFPSPTSRRSFYDPVHEAVHKINCEAISEAVYEAIADYDARSQSNTSPTFHDSSLLTPLEKWEQTYERHEMIAYRFEQPPNRFLELEQSDDWEPLFPASTTTHSH